MDSAILEEQIMKEVKNLSEQEKNEVFDFIQFIAGKRKSKDNQVCLDNLIGSIEFEEDASTEHDKYIYKA